MCKELGAYPKCTCPGYTDTTDKTPGVMTWDELLTYMDDVSSNGHAANKGWKAGAGAPPSRACAHGRENRKEKEEYDIASCVQYAENNQWTVGGEAEKSCVHVISCFQMCEDGYSGKKNPHNLDKYCTEHCSGF